MVSFTPWPIYSWGDTLCCPLNRKLVGTQSQSGRFGKSKHNPSDVRLLVQSLFHYVVKASVYIDIKCKKRKHVFPGLGRLLNPLPEPGHREICMLRKSQNSFSIQIPTHPVFHASCKIFCNNKLKLCCERNNRLMPGKLKCFSRCFVAAAAVKSRSELTVKQRVDISYTTNLAARSAHDL